MKFAIVAILTKIDHLISMLLAALILIFHARQIANAEIFVYIQNGGYGHTITDVDIARRLFGDKKLIVIYPSEIGRHNWKQAKIWPDAKVIHIVKSIRYHAISQNLGMEKFVLMILRKIFGIKIFELSESVSLPEISREVVLELELHALLIRKVTLTTGKIDQPSSVSPRNIFLAYWFRSIELFPRLPPALPCEQLKKIEKKLTLELGSNYKIATIYMRLKGMGTDGERRCGSGFETYSASVDLLLQRGFTIFLVGDRSLEECPELERKKYYTAKRLGINQEWFNLYASTQCRLFVGDPGGGSLLPSILNIPRLMVNAYPYAQALHGYLILFKRTVDLNGDDIPLDICFAKMPYDLDHETTNGVRSNTGAEILEAVKEIESVAQHRWLEYIKADNFKAVNSNATNLRNKPGRLSFGPCRLVATQQQTLQDMVSIK